MWLTSDKYFNMYVSKSVEYLKTHTNMTVPNLHENTTITDLLGLMHNAISHPHEYHAEIPFQWNLAIVDRIHKDLIVTVLFIFFHSDELIKPYIVILMSLLESYDIGQLAN